MAQRLTASFRGVTFFVEASEISAGRRVVTHQYPQRDEPLTEDLGRAARVFSLSAFVLGDDCIEQAQALRDAIEQPGPGTLVHPEFGELQVIAQPGGSMSFDQARRRVRFSLSFVEAGLNAFPESGRATQSASREAADGLMESAIDDFAETINLDGVEDFVKTALEGDLLDSLGIISNSEIASVLGFADRVSDLASNAIGLVSGGPRAFATRLMGALGLSGLATTVAGWQRVGTQLCNLVDDLHGEHEEPLYSGNVKSTSAKTIEANRAAVYRLSRAAVLVQTVGVSTLIGTDLDSSVATSAILPVTTTGSTVQTAGTAPATQENAAAEEILAFEDDTSDGSPTISWDEMKASMDRIVEALEEEMLDADNDEVFMSLRKAATAVSQDLSERAHGVARLYDYNAGSQLPACVIAMELYGDAARARELTVRNGIPHQLFCPNVVKVINE